MLLGVDKAQEIFVEPLAGQRSIGYVAAGTFFIMVMFGLFLSGPSGSNGAPEGAPALALTGQSGLNPIDETPDVNQLAGDIFSSNLVAFQATALLLTIATIGAVVMVKNSKRIDELSLAGVGSPVFDPDPPEVYESAESSSSATVADDLGASDVDEVNSKETEGSPANSKELTEFPGDSQEPKGPSQEDSLINFEDLDGSDDK